MERSGRRVERSDGEEWKGVREESAKELGREVERSEGGE